MNYRYKKTVVVAVLFSLVATMPGQVHAFWWPWSSTSTSSSKNTSNTGTIVAVASASFVAGVGTTCYLFWNVFKKPYTQKPQVATPILSETCERSECVSRAQECNFLNGRLAASRLVANEISEENDELALKNSRLKTELVEARAETEKKSLLSLMAMLSLKRDYNLVPKSREEQASFSCQNGGYAQKDDSGEFYAEIPHEGDSEGSFRGFFRKNFSSESSRDSDSDASSQSSFSDRESNLSDFDNEVD